MCLRQAFVDRYGRAAPPLLVRYFPVLHCRFACTVVSCTVRWMKCAVEFCTFAHSTLSRSRPPLRLPMRSDIEVLLPKKSTLTSSPIIHVFVLGRRRKWYISTKQIQLTEPSRRSAQSPRPFMCRSPYSAASL
jgi:hypothetical protein